MYTHPLPSRIRTHELLPTSTNYYLDEITTEVEEVSHIMVSAFLVCEGGEVGIMAMYPNGDGESTITHSFPLNHTLECRDIVWLDTPCEFDMSDPH